MEAIPKLAAVVASARDLHPDCYHVGSVESLVDVLEVGQAADEETRADEQHHAEGDFNADERTAGTPTGPHSP